MIATGGHGFDREAFFEMFNGVPGIRYTEVRQPEANVRIEEGRVAEFDVLVFYDMYDSISESQKEAYEDLVRQGKPMIFLHHALVSYQGWPGFTSIIGGKYNTNDSTKTFSDYEHDVLVLVKIADSTHPVTRGLKDFEIPDEVYGRCFILPGVKPLLTTDHPKSLPYLAWINKTGNSSVLYIQLGHGPGAFSNPNYRLLISQAIQWSAHAHHH